MSRQAWICVAASATHHWMVWRSASGAPNVTRWRACSQIMSTARWAMPMHQHAICTRRVESRIGAGAGLGNADRRYRLAARVGPEIGLALLFIGGDHQHAQIGRVRRKRVGRHRLAQLLVDPDHGFQRQVRAAELARRIEPPQSELTGLGIDGLALRFRQSGSLAAAFALEYLRLERHERVGDEARHQLLEHPMLFAELEIHEPSLGWRPPQFTWVSRAMASASPSAPGRRHESCPTSAGSARGLPPRSGARACRRPGEAAQRALPGPLTKILGNSRSNFLRRII